MIGAAPLLDNGHLQRLFHFALGKTGNVAEAEELAQETAYEAIITLSKGRGPEDFDAWLWGVARHRYARWAKARRMRHESIEGMGGEGGDPYPDPVSEGVEDQVIRAERMDLLRRELTLLSREYRGITVSYYLEGNSVADIARVMGLPEGTIKRKLHESRKQLREGMQMARRYGKRSYAPEEISFTKSGIEGTDGSPWNKIDRMIPKNILLEAYGNPSTIEELSLSLGVAAPYMEEEVVTLERATLLKALKDGRYETDFVIIGKEAQLANFHATVEAGNRLAALVLQGLDDSIDSIRGIGFHGCGMPSEDLYWLLLPRAVDFIIGSVKKTKGVPKGYTKRPFGGCWDLMGYEDCRLPSELFVGLNGNGDSGMYFSTYAIKAKAFGLEQRAGMPDNQSTMTLGHMMRSGNRRLADMVPPARGIMDSLAERGFITVDGKGVVNPTFPVFHDGNGTGIGKLFTCMTKTVHGPAAGIVSGLFDGIIGRVLDGVPPRLEGQAKFVASDCLCDLRMVVLLHALEAGRLRMPEDPAHSTIAMWMEIS